MNFPAGIQVESCILMSKRQGSYDDREQNTDLSRLGVFLPDDSPAGPAAVTQRALFCRGPSTAALELGSPEGTHASRTKSNAMLGRVVGVKLESNICRSVFLDVRRRLILSPPPSPPGETASRVGGQWKIEREALGIPSGDGLKEGDALR
ncbi:hypothetical protein DL764_010118 [Monosporascus ibericus]|uniref:Uncharacterized protein n=1 Tax=Monosporascus ibericus TaxID=155417 RepID=A0A4Q4SW24_9PEZI|nr:hypothetical protein DL764_010118 [Monosporascus ibericus]